MSYVGLGAAPSSQIQRALSLLPPCHSQAFEECYEDEKLTAFPGCKEILDAYYVEGDDGAVATAVDELPYCPVPPGAREAGVMQAGWKSAAAVGIIGVLVGVLIGRKL